MTERLTEGFLLGLALSPACLGICLPLLLPFFSAESRPPRANILAFGWFLFGRLAGYVLMGGLAGWVGTQIISHAPLVQEIDQAANLGMGGILLFYALLHSFPHWSFCRQVLHWWPAVSTPLGLGLLTGINICPPFMAVLMEAGQSHDILSGVQILLAFFVGTTLVLLPLPMVGALAKAEAIQVAGKVATALVGVWMLVKGLGILA
jgi:sulfite exporter TauE/SafE